MALISAGEISATAVADRWIVQKIGGTSLGKFAVRIAEDIIRSGHISIVRWDFRKPFS